MDLADLLKPGALFRARRRDYRLEDLRKDLLLARAVDTEEEALFHLPLEDRGIRLTWSLKVHNNAPRPSTRMRFIWGVGAPERTWAYLPPLPRSLGQRSEVQDGLEGRKVPGHLKPEEGKGQARRAYLAEAYPQDPPGMGTGGVPSFGYPLPAPQRALKA